MHWILRLEGNLTDHQVSKAHHIKHIIPSAWSHGGHQNVFRSLFSFRIMVGRSVFWKEKEIKVKDNVDRCRQSKMDNIPDIFEKLRISLGAGENSRDEESLSSVQNLVDALINALKETKGNWDSYFLKQEISPECTYFHTTIYPTSHVTSHPIFPHPPGISSFTSHVLPHTLFHPPHFIPHPIHQFYSTPFPFSTPLTPSPISPVHPNWTISWECHDLSQSSH